MSLLDDETLWSSSVVANCAMNRERGLASYRRELGTDLALRPGDRWVDLCCGSGKALAEAARDDVTIIGVDLANFDVDSVRRADGTAFGRVLTKALREAGFTYDNRNRRVSRVGAGSPRLPFAYLGADDKAGPNYTGQPAVHSCYEPC
ncbi:class I SAM-dependent methyltransferase [Lentzea sp. NPDC059081]|uniref:class I SAM-dependent methyltransferase n=1 Tax=Lentzea sp. NPDC059081 TaxID=3346719 RepID=UPI0036AFE8A8